MRTFSQDDFQVELAALQEISALMLLDGFPEPQRRGAAIASGRQFTAIFDDHGLGPGEHVRRAA